ncbi:MAG: stage II sporulation protein R [Oscillospiraceae bacterium]|nr:stage II sporulation protein R [Oscillospiraceae bacterium]
MFKKISWKLIGVSVILTVIISNFVQVGKSLDSLRENVLRMHILANSDSIADQSLKLKVRDAILEHSEEIFGKTVSFEDFKNVSAENLEKIHEIAQAVIDEYGFDYEISVEETKMFFDERTYGDITMPAGDYDAVRVTIGSAEGHNWWCVMYPPLCIPMASEITDDKEIEQEFFSTRELDMIRKPEKYEVRFMLWDKLKDFCNR